MLSRGPLTTIILSFVALASCRSTKESAYDLLKKADHYADLYNWRAASPIYKRAEPLLKANGDRRNGIYAHIGALRVASTVPFIERLQELGGSLKTDPVFLQDKELRLFALAVKGDLDGEMGQSAAARQDWIEVKNLAADLGNTKWIYRAEGQLGFADYYDGDLVLSQRRVTSALIAATKASDVGAEIFFLSTIANGYEMQRLLLPLAIDYAKKAIALARAHPDAGPPMIANMVLVRALAATGQVSRAKQLVQTLLSNPNLYYAEQYNYLAAAGDAALAEKDYRGAIRYFENAGSIARAYGYFRETADLQNRISGVYLQIGNISKAEELVRSAIQILQASKASPLLPAKFDSLAQVLIAQKKYADARAVYEKAETLQDSLIGKADTLIVKTALITGAGQLYAHHFALLADDFNDLDAAYNVVEEGRGRAVVDLLLSSGSSSPQAVETERRISSLRLQMAAARPDEMDRLRQAIFLAEQSRAVNPDLTILATKQFRPISAQAIQESLRPSEMLLEYVLADPYSYVLCFSPDSGKIIKLAGRRTIEKMVADYRNAVKQRANPIRQAHDLYTTLLNPVPRIDAAAHWVIIPDGALNLLPFDALADEHEKYVVESHVVSYAPSASTMYLLRTKELVLRRGKALLAVGGVPYDQSGIKQKVIERGYTPDQNFENIPNSEREATVAATAIKNSDNEELTGTAATETNLKRALAKHFGYVHLAVHAFSSDNPDRAALVVLSDPSAGEDGFVEASEILQMRLPAKLVVLSACDTNVGPIEGEEGVSALSTAFLLAGGRTVVSTLWAIEDVPSLILMKAFYKHLGTGDSVADSMAEAKRDVLSKFGSQTLPIDWAGFIVEGSETKEALRAHPATILRME
jgi:CHAT domain-containing protein